MLAVQLTAWGQPPQVREIPVPEPAEGQLLIKVGAAGLCRSDLHVMDSPAGRFDYPLPLTLGHEVAGTVVGAGPLADHAWIGENVVIHGVWPCGRCRNCRRERENYCLEKVPRGDGRLSPIGNGLGHPGGLAEYLLVPSEAVLVRVGSLSPEQAAPLADAGLTTYHAIRTNSDLIDSDTVALVIGIGGLGHLAVQILLSFGVTDIIAVETRTQTHALALESGARACFATLAEATEAVASLGGADVVFDFVGAQATVEPAPALLAPGGRVVVVGSAGGQLTVGKSLGLVNGWQVRAPFWGTIEDLRQVVELASAGKLHAEVTTFTFDSALEAYDRLRSGDLSGRAVLVPTAPSSL